MRGLLFSIFTLIFLVSCQIDNATNKDYPIKCKLSDSANLSCLSNGNYLFLERKKDIISRKNNPKKSNIKDIKLPVETRIVCGNTEVVGKQIIDSNLFKKIEEICSQIKESPGRVSFPNLGINTSGNTTQQKIARMDNAINECKDASDISASLSQAGFAIPAMEEFLMILVEFTSNTGSGYILGKLVDDEIGSTASHGSPNDDSYDSGWQTQQKPGVATGDTVTEGSASTRQTKETQIHPNGSKTVTETKITVDKTTETKTDSNGNETRITTTKITINKTVTKPDGTVEKDNYETKIQDTELSDGTVNRKTTYRKNGHIVATKSETLDTNSAQGNCREGLCSMTCSEKKAWWEFFKNECNKSNWQAYECKKFLEKSEGCPDPGLILPGPDGNYHCGFIRDKEAVKKARLEFCKKQQGVMKIVGNNNVCVIESLRTNTSLGSSICNDPRAIVTEDKCTLEFEILEPPQIPDITPFSSSSPTS